MGPMTSLAGPPSGPTRRLAWLLLLGLGGCTELPSIAAQGCGNRVVDDAEDCDQPALASGAAHCAQPGEAHECRYLCASAAGAHECPSGYACGNDGVCRVAKGNFVSLGRSIEAASTSLQAGDFDGDAAADLLALGPGDFFGNRSGQVAFFGDQMQLSSQQRLPGLLGSPVVGRFASSAYAGLALTTQNGVVTLMGQRDRQFLPQTYPTFGIPDDQRDDFGHVAVFALPLIPTRAETAANGETALAYQGDEQLIYITSKQNPGLHLFGAVLSAVGKPLPLQLLPHGPADLLGEPVLWRPSTAQACPTIVFAFDRPDDNRLYTLQPCTLDAKGQPIWKDLGSDLQSGNPLQALTLLPIGKFTPRVTGQPSVVDFDQDGHLDVLVPVFYVQEQGLTLSFSYIGYGDEDGHLYARDDKGKKALQDALAPLLLDPSKVGPSIGGVGCAGEEGIVLGPLAVGDLDGDGEQDIVTRLGVCTSRALIGTGVNYHLSGPTLDLLSEARLIDLNGDGRLDVVGRPERGSALLTFLNVSDGQFTPGNIPLNGPARQLRAGDFDGDGLGDVAFIEGKVLSDGARTGDAVSVLFGSHDPDRREVLRMGRFDAIDSIATGRTRDQPLSDIGLVSRNVVDPDNEPGGRIGISLLAGSADRALRAPLLLDQLPVSVAAGRFLADTPSDRQDISVLTVDSIDNPAGQTQTLWFVPLLANGELRDLPIRQSLLTEVNALPLAVGVSRYGKVFAGDLERDGLDELLLLDAQPAATTTEVRLRTARPASGLSAALPELRLPVQFSPASALVLADVDGDGQREVLVTGKEPGRDPGEDSGRLLVLTRQPDGTLAPGPTLAAPTGFLTGPLCVLRRGGRETVLALGSGTTWQLASSSGALSLAPAPGLALRGGAAMACDDLDGDGVDDVALSSGSLIEVFRGEPVRP